MSYAEVKCKSAKILPILLFMMSRVFRVTQRRADESIIIY